ncbi:formate dehydrogenase [Anaerobacillus arseniciselenatis]|uniref:Formate dehydrogenase n=3 Tax=Anaerobacillus arseniciselenatis TaxID=85682 RepID=A0A1S2LGL0_9BACI|nr:formate dehydrogenase [Anaerobacillus arseniciselenatis]
MFDLSRRQFLKLSGATAATVAVVELGFNPNEAKAQANEYKIARASTTPTICPYCSVGCGILVHVNEEKNDVLYTEGDPDHPINKGSLCSKGTSIRQLYTSDRRVEKPLYRAPGSSEWVEKDWDWTLNKIAEKIKKTRDESFVERENGITVNRTEAIASLGGAALENEECYLIAKFMRGLGATFIEHQARI